MMRTGTKRVMLALVVGLMVVGGCGQEQQQIRDLQSSYNKLSEQSDLQRDELARAEAGNAAMRKQLGVKDTELSRKDLAIRSLQQQLNDERSKTAAKPTGKGWRSTGYGDRITITSDLLFRSGQALLNAEGKSTLNKIARDLKTTYAGLPVRICGHTDTDAVKASRRSWKDNLDLSANRAMAVARQLRANGIKPERIETIAMGATTPIAPNTTRAGKQKNRRVEIIVVKQ